MDKYLDKVDEQIKIYEKLNNEVEVIDVKNRRLYLKCKKCGNIWNVCIAAYKRQPTCPKCRPKIIPSPQCGKKLSNEEWIARAKTVHPEYIYDNTQYKNASTSLIITCPVHGDFSIPPKAFMKKDYKCAKCKKEEKWIEEGKKFIEEAKKVHGEKYDYSKTHFNGLKSKLLITCSKHGDFWQLAKYHLNGCGCPKCWFERSSEEKKITFEEFLRRAIEKHGDKYDYSKVEYKDYDTEVCIICPIHGEFWQTPKYHISTKGCTKCSGQYHYNREEIIERFRTVHGDKYDYSKVDFKTTHDKVCIICHEKDEFGKEHGEFWQTPKNHLKYGCKKCSKNYLDTEMFIDKARKIHGDRYDYSKVDYKNEHIKVIISCPEHGEFLQAAGSHINGRGCPLCKTSHLERSVEFELKKTGKLYVYQYHNKKIFGQQSLDFYFPSLKLAIECQGEQHYIANFFKSKGIDYAEKHLKYIKKLDARKRKLCKENGIELIYFTEKKFVKFEKSKNKVFTSINEIIEYINSKN